MVRERMEAAYDQIAEEYAHLYPEMPPRVVELGTRFLNLIGPAARVLDAGCGPGRDMAWMESRGFLVTGIDLSRGMLAQARPHVRGALLHMDMCHLTFADVSFTGIWCCSSFFHLPRNEALEALKQMHRVLIPGGMLYLSLLEGEGETWTETGFAGVKRYFVHYAHDEARNMLSQAGFAPFENHRDEAPGHAWLNFFAQRPLVTGW